MRRTRMRLGPAAAEIAVAAACATGATSTAAGSPEPNHESLAGFLGLFARQHSDAHLALVARRYPKVPFVTKGASLGGGVPEHAQRHGGGDPAT